MSELPQRIYSPDSPLRRPAELVRHMVSDLAASRELAWSLTVRDFKSLYRQSYAGYAWAFLPPLVASLTFILLRQSGVVSFQSTSIPYPAFVLIGTVLWQIFVDSLNNPIRTLQGNRQMLVKILFPREALIVSAVQMSLLNVAIRLVILVPVMIWFRFPLSGSLLLAPVGLFSLVLLGTVVGLLIGTLGLLYQDIQRGIVMLTGIWMFLTPVVYPEATKGVVGLLMRINPVTQPLVATRSWLSGETLSDPGGFIVVILGTLVALLFGWLVYRLLLPRIIERLGM